MPLPCPALVILIFDTLHNSARQVLRFATDCSADRFAPSGDWPNCSAKAGYQDDKGYVSIVSEWV